MSSERPLESKTGGRAATTGVIPGDFAISVGNPGTALAEGWTWTLLTDVARLETGHTPSRKHPEYWGGNVPWVGIRDATGNHGQTILKTAQYTNELGIRNSSARILPAHTVCLSRTASVGYVVVMGVPMATSQDFVNWVCGPELDYRFLKYILLGERSSFLRFASGTTHQTIYFPEVKAFHAALPDLDTQRAVADVLSALDDRITLLRETNATLEAIAQALFKSWFVDFDPVRAKMAGRAPEGMDEATAALFPDALEETELGVVPKGWRPASVYEIATVIYGAPFASKQFKSEPPGTPLVRIRDLKDERPGVYTEEVHPKGYMLQPGDIAVGMDGEFRAYLWGGGPAWLNQRVCVFQPIGEAGSVFVRLSVAPLLAEVEASETATTVIHLGKNDIDRFRILLPDAAVLERFGELAGPLYQRVVSNKRQVQSLSGLRDTLLPRLISGQLRLPEAQAPLEEALA
ncbi:restriction endonuclease subunit S [Paracidovorax avenae]|uniref:restriction endonuclease subunit S n=1 Tax=Paracidovorax avenae TaxID=80867 RepID=UPI000D151F8C|nr:restriction endonuclease subunit S [Paracidovorax avenae]AVS63814.1 restriction endonuclease subunit S [Paracidovorax avenae]